MSHAFQSIEYCNIIGIFIIQSTLLHLVALIVQAKQTAANIQYKHDLLEALL